MRRAGWLLMVTVVLAACSSGPSRQAVIGDLAQSVAVPGFQAVASRVDALDMAVVLLCADPSAATLQDAQTAWRETRAAWMRTTPFWFGPVTGRSRTLLDWGMVDPERLEQVISERDSTTAEDAREFLPATVRGLGAVELLLFHGPPEEVVAALRERQRCEYLMAITRVAADEARAISEEWSGSYAQRVAGDGADALSEDDAVNFAAGTQVHLLKRLADMEVGPALGTTSPTPLIDAIPGAGAGHDTEDYRQQVGGIRDLYLGPSGDDGLTAVVRARSADADDRVRVALDEAVSAIDAVEGSMKDAATAYAPEILLVYQKLKHLQLIWNTEVVSLLGVTVGFTDADGDSG